MKNVLITGAGGFIGSNLVKRLIKMKKYKVFCIDIKNKDENIILKKLNSKNLKYFKRNFLKIRILIFCQKKLT